MPEPLNSMVTSKEEHREPSRKHCILFLVVFLYFVVFTLNTTSTEKYIEYRVTKNILKQDNLSGFIDIADMGFCESNFTELLWSVTLQEELGPVRKNLGIASAVPAVCSVLVLGPLSDKYGRRLAIILPIVGTLARAIGYAIVNALDASISILYIPHILEGLCGFFPTVLMASMAYICDISDRNGTRTIMITLVTALYTLGQISFAFQVNAIADWGYTYPHLVTIVLSIVTLVITWFVLPASKKSSQRQESVLSYFKRTAELYLSTANSNPVWLLHMGCFLFGIVSFVFYGQTDIEPIVYAVQSFCWKLTFSGNFELFRGVIQSLSSVFIVTTATNYFPDGLIAAVGTLFQIVGLVVEGFAKSTALVSLTSLLGAGSGISLSMIKVMMSKLITSDAYGSLFSIIAFLEVITSSVSTFAFLQIFYHFAETGPGVVFYFMAGMMGVAAALYTTLYLLIRRRERYQTIPMNIQ